jgi:hypothetical protein
VITKENGIVIQIEIEVQIFETKLGQIAHQVFNSYTQKKLNSCFLKLAAMKKTSS